MPTTHLAEECHYDSSVRKFTTRHCRECLLSRLRLLELDVDLADTWRCTSTGRPWDLDIQNLAILFALFLDVEFDV
jgi:hypothetical protein